MERLRDIKLQYLADKRRASTAPFLVAHEFPRAPFLVRAPFPVRSRPCQYMARVVMVRPGRSHKTCGKMAKIPSAGCRQKQCYRSQFECVATCHMQSARKALPTRVKVISHCVSLPWRLRNMHCGAWRAREDPKTFVSTANCRKDCSGYTVVQGIFRGVSRVRLTSQHNSHAGVDHGRLPSH